MLELPKQLEARKDGDAWWVEIDGRDLRLSNLNKVFWPKEEYTKGVLLERGRPDRPPPPRTPADDETHA